MRKTWLSSNTSSTRRLSSAASAREVPKGFSMITRTSAWVVHRCGRSPCAAEGLDDHGEEGGCGGEVEGAVELFARALLEAVEHLRELR